VTGSPTPGEIFFRIQPQGEKKTRTAAFGTVEREVEIIGRLGPHLDVFDVKNGGHGEVYFCLEDPQPGRSHPTIPLACKIFPEQLLYHPVRRRAFFRECVLAVQLGSLPGFIDSHILSVDGMPVLAMPAFLRGEDGIVNLRDLLAGPDLPVSVVAFLGWCVAGSMHMADEFIPGLVHGDLKPENILIQGGIPFIADFGLAQSMRYAWGSDTLPGTPAYLAPEAGRSDAKLTQSTDVFAFGRMLLEMLEKAAGGQDETVKKRIFNLGGRCIAPDPSGRPRGFEEIARELRSMFSESDGDVERSYTAWKLFEAYSLSWAVVFPEGDLESLTRLQQWDLVHELVERWPPEQRSAQLWHYHGLALTRMGRDTEGLESLNLALARIDYEIKVVGHPLGSEENAGEKEIFDIMYDIAVLHVNAGHYAEAESLGRDLFDAAKTPAQARHASLVIAMALARMGRFNEADQLFSKLMFHEDDPQRRSEAFILWADIRAHQGQAEQAVELMQEAIRLNPGNASNHRKLGEVLMLRLGAAGLAAAAFENAMLCGDLSEEVLVMRLTCLLAEAEEGEIEGIRAAAEFRHGPEIMAAAWPKALAWVESARDGDESMGPAPPELAGDKSRTLDFGDLLVEVSDVGFYTFDFYHAHNDDEYIDRLVFRYREMTANIVATLRGTPVILTRCAVCRSDVTTNRPLGSAFSCAVCGSANRVVALLGRQCVQLREAVTAALGLDEDLVSGQGCCVAVQPRTTWTEQQAAHVREVARRHGLEPIPLTHPAAIWVHMDGITCGRFRSQSEPICAIYWFPEGSRHAAKLTPPRVEDYLTEVRGFFDVPVDSTSARIDFTSRSFSGLILADRLNEAAEAAARESDIRERMSQLLLLSKVFLLRRELDVGLRHATEALRLDSANEEAWVVKGYFDLLKGNYGDAQFSVGRALELNQASSSALALLGAVQHLSGAEPEVVWSTLARAITLGALHLPAR
jgi:tetratricopeptide (TPR) repeat protein